MKKLAVTISAAAFGLLGALLGSLVASSGGCSTTPRGAPRAERPNIVLILADDLGCETLGCYGGTSYETPRIDRLASSGTRFLHAYSMPVCHPTRIALLTGRYPFRLGNPRWGTFPLSAEHATIAHVLRSAGYATAVAGKWQIALLGKEPDHPHRLGFDEYCLFGWHEGPRYYQPLIRQNGEVRTDVSSRYGPDVYSEFLIDFMARHQDRPFFVFYSMALCHDVTDDLDRPVPFGPRGRYDSYGEMVEAMDARVGRLVDALDRLGIREKTLVIFTADNGTPKRSIIRAVDGKLVRENVSSRLGDVVVPGGKGELTDGGTRVPFVASWPGVVEENAVRNDLIDFSDFLPTFVELGGAHLPGGVAVDGRSFAPRLRGATGGGRRWAFAEHGGRSWVRTRRWKLYSDGRLFDMDGDPRETSPIPRDASAPPDAARARSELEAARVELLVGARS